MIEVSSRLPSLEIESAIFLQVSDRDDPWIRSIFLSTSSTSSSSVGAPRVSFFLGVPTRLPFLRAFSERPLPTSLEVVRRLILLEVAFVSALSDLKPNANSLASDSGV